ncbi:MAG: hypothetical protein IKF17_05035 [Clostridia bacterium]|nr:hypothetical protein [Clostridia bacterium]
MPKKTEKPKEEIKEKLEYLGLDLSNIPKNLQVFEPLKFKPSSIYEENKHKQYRFVPVKDIEIILSPTNRLDDLQDKYSKASPIYSYLVPDKKENVLRHTVFLQMLKSVKIEEIEKIEEEQKALNKAIPFKVKYPGNYLWQIYYSETTDKYFMLVPTEDSDYSTFFYLLKKKLEKRQTSKIFVPISHIDYSNEYLKKNQFEDIENYLWLFTKDWPLIYEVYDKKNELSIQIVGETEVFDNVKSIYKVKLQDKTKANEFYRLLKALFMLQSEVPHYYTFETNIDRYGSIEFYSKDEKIDYENLAEFIKKEYVETEELHEQADIDIVELKEKLNKLKILASSMEIEYLAKEKQISTFLECKKSFFGKMKYYFKYNKKSKSKSIKEKINLMDIDEDETFDEKAEEKRETDIKSNKKIKEHYTIEELIDTANEYYQKETKMRNLLMDINAIKLRNKNLEKKIENASAYIEEIDSHKKSIFEFWKYSNKDEISSLPEGEIEEINIKKKISKVFNYKEDLEEFGKAMDRQQRKILSKEELDSIFITTTNVFEILNKVKTNTVLPKDIESALKLIKKEIKEEKGLEEQDDFDIFGGKADDNTKVKKIADKKHRELPKDKYQILDITKNTKQLGYKLALERVLDNIESSLEKIKVTENIAIYLAINEEKIDEQSINIFNLNPEREVKKAIEKEGNKINLYKINLNRNDKAIIYTNSVFYDNKNKTLPIGMDLSTNVLFDMSKTDLEIENKRTFRIVKVQEDGKIVVKAVNVIEYNVE